MAFIPCEDRLVESGPSAVSFTPINTHWASTYHGVASNIALKLLWIAINHLNRMDEDPSDDDTDDNIDDVGE